jgi:hypothetical protein
MSSSSGNPPIQFRDNLPFVPKGTGFPQVWFSGGRLGATILGHGGIGQILYYGNQSVSHAFFFQSTNSLSAWEKLFRLSIVIDGKPWYPEFNNTTYYPFGFTSECTLDGVRFEHQLVALNDALVQRVKVVANPSRKKLALRMITHGMNRVQNKFRTWQPWKDSKLGLITSAADKLSKEEIAKQIWDKTHDVRDHFPVSDTPYGETHICLVYDRSHTIENSMHNWKYYTSSGAFTDEAALSVVFAPGAAALRKRAAQIKRSVHRECDALFALFAKRQRDATQVRIPSEPVVQSLVANVPRVIDAVEVKDVPGAFRAGMQNYFVWMDLILDGVSFLYANDAESLRDMLYFFNQRVDKKRGVPCLVTTHLTPLLATPFSSQCPIITTFYNYYCFTGDEAALRQCYPMLRFITEKCKEGEVRGTGLIVGAGTPDYPAEQDGKDVTSCNNSYFYQGMKAMRYLSAEMARITGRKKYAIYGEACDQLAARTLKSFGRYLYDKKVGYFLDSLSAKDFKPRRHYPTFAIQWTTPFAADLIAGREKPIAAFLIKNFLRKNGVGPMFPPWDPMYPGDGNQWLAYYPSWTESFFRGALRAAGRGKELGQLIDVMNWFWSRYTIPEGFTYDAENEGFTPDNPGGKQPFGGQGLHGNFFRTIVGVEVDERGVIVTPSPTQLPLTMEGLLVRGKKIDVKISGKGKTPEITFNGKKLGAGPAIIPFRKLKARNQIVIKNG